jgi:hypothetical protein
VLRRLVREGTIARETVPKLVGPYVRTEIRRLQRAVQVRASVFGEDDAMRVGEALLSRLADRFATNDRPFASWGYAAHFEIQKLRRELWKTDLEPTDVIELRIRIQNGAEIGPNMTVEQIERALAGPNGKTRWTRTQIEHAKTPQIRFCSMEEQIVEGAELGEIIADPHASADEPRPREHRSTYEQWFKNAPDGLMDKILPLLAKAGLVNDEKDRVIPTTPTAIKNARRALFEVFCRAGETLDADQAAVTARAIEAFAPGGCPNDADEMADFWAFYAYDREGALASLDRRRNRSAVTVVAA